MSNQWNEENNEYDISVSSQTSGTNKWGFTRVLPSQVSDAIYFMEVNKIQTSTKLNSITTTSQEINPKSIIQGKKKNTRRQTTADRKRSNHDKTW